MKTNKKAFLFCLAVLFLVFCVSQIFSSPPLQEVAEKAPDKPSKHVYEEEVYQAASRAYFARKPLLIVFGASWCVPCKKLKTTLKDKRFKDMLEKKFIVLYLDTDGPNKDWIKKNFPNVKAVPHMEIIDTKAQKSLKQFTGFSNTEEWKDKLFKELSNLKLKEQ